MFRAETRGRDTYSGIHIRSNVIVLSHEFCERYVKSNAFVALTWDDTTGILELTFHLSDGVNFRVPLSKNSNRSTRIPHAKFFSQLRPFKMGRYNIFDVNPNPSGDLTFKFKLEKK